MGPNGVVVVPQVLDDPCGVAEIAEPLDTQALVRELAAEAFDEGILDVFGGPNELQEDAVLVRPDVERATRELRTVVAHGACGSPVRAATRSRIWSTRSAGSEWPASIARHSWPCTEAEPAAYSNRVTPSKKLRVVATVVERAGRYLVGERPAHKRHGGLWEFPGGKLEPGETVPDAAKRELAEELGVALLSVGDRLFAIDDPGSNFVIEFYPAAISGEPVCHEHAAVRWATVGELLTMPLAPSDSRFVLHLNGAAPALD